MHLSCFYWSVTRSLDLPSTSSSAAALPLQVAKFWELQGTTLKIPLVERRALDLYTLKRFVAREGGMERVNADKKWTKVASDMGYMVSGNKSSVGGVLKAHYERILFPLEVFEREEEKKKADLKLRIEQEQQEVAKEEIVSVRKKWNLLSDNWLKNICVLFHENVTLFQKRC